MCPVAVPERRMENEQKTFIYILKVDASISPKSISVPHIFGALPTYGTFKVGPRPLLLCPAPPSAMQSSCKICPGSPHNKKRGQRNSRGISSANPEKTRIQFANCRKKMGKWKKYESQWILKHFPGKLKQVKVRPKTATTD